MKTGLLPVPIGKAETKSGDQVLEELSEQFQSG